MVDIDPDRLRALVGALGGAAIYGLVQFGATALSGHTPSREEYRALSLNIACAVAAGAILAFFLVKVAAPMIPFAPLRDASAFGFAVGAFGWELLPLAFKVITNRARRQAAEAAGEGQVMDLSPVDIATGVNAVIAGFALALRGNMLKPEARAWASSRTASLVIMGLSVTMGGAAIDVFSRGGATPRELAVVFAVAVSSVAMLMHLWRQRQAPRG